MPRLPSTRRRPSRRRWARRGVRAPPSERQPPPTPGGDTLTRVTSACQAASAGPQAIPRGTAAHPPGDRDPRIERQQQGQRHRLRIALHQQVAQGEGVAQRLRHVFCERPRQSAQQRVRLTALHARLPDALQSSYCPGAGRRRARRHDQPQAAQVNGCLDIRGAGGVAVPRRHRAGSGLSAPAGQASAFVPGLWMIFVRQHGLDSTTDAHHVASRSFPGSRLDSAQGGAPGSASLTFVRLIRRDQRLKLSGQ